MINIAELFDPPLIQAQSYQELERKVNEYFQEIARMLNNIYTGANIPNTRLVAGTKIDGIATGAEVNPADLSELDAAQDTKLDGIEAAADVTATHQAATIASQGNLATQDVVTGAQVNVADLAEIVSALGTQVSGILEAGVQLDSSWRKIYDYTFTGNATSVTLSGLDGDTDVEYFISVLWVKNGTAANNFGIQCNADAGVSNYAFHNMYNAGDFGDDTYFMLTLGRADTDGYFSQGWGRLFAKSGWSRTLLGQMNREVSASAITGHYSNSACWWNTASNLTSLKFLAEVADGLKIGTHIEVWKRIA